MSNLLNHAQEELRRNGLFDKNSDYEGMLGEAVLELIDVFSKQGHSGFSASMTVALFKQLAMFKNIGPLTNDQNEWANVTDFGGPHDGPMWQNKRRSDAFSFDGGNTYYTLEDVDKYKQTLRGKINMFFIRLFKLTTIDWTKMVGKKAKDVRGTTPEYPEQKA